MSPGSHYAPSHASDQPMTSPAAGALPPQHGPPQNMQQNSAQMTRNCVQQNHQNVGYYPMYGCQAQMTSNCGQVHANGQNCSVVHAAGSAQQCSQMRNCQINSHCGVQSGNPSIRTPGHPGSQCGQSAASPCTPVSRTMLPGSEMNPHETENGVRTPGSCGAMGAHCAQAALKPNLGGATGNQQSPGVQCPQMTANCVHPGMTSPRHAHNGTSNVPKGMASVCTMQNACRAAACGHSNCQPPGTASQYVCNCQWSYSTNEQCYNGHAAGEIQCRDISQSQQGSPVKPPQGMRQDSYRRTLEYVQQCRNWSGTAQTHETNVSSSTHPLSLPQPLPASTNMVVNDMTSSLSSLLEENRYLQMIQ